MAMTCRVCASNYKAEIDTAIEANQPVLAISRQYPISRASITRHKNKCYPAMLAQRALSQYRRVNADDILTSIMDTRDEARSKLQGTPIQYLAPMMRVVNESDKALLEAGMAAERLRIDREKLDMAKAGRGGDVRAKLADYMRRHHATACPHCGESIERWLRECPE